MYHSLPDSDVAHRDAHCGYLWKTAPARLTTTDALPSGRRPCSQCCAPWYVSEEQQAEEAGRDWMEEQRMGNFFGRNVL